MGDYMKLYVSFSRGYAFGLCLFALVSFAVLAVAGNGKTYKVFENELSREYYIKSKGYSVTEPFTVKNIVVDGEGFTEYTYIAKDKTIIRLCFDGVKLVGEKYDRYKTG